MLFLPSVVQQEQRERENNQENNALRIHMNQGTGSKPPAFRGWQRRMRLTASQLPPIAPCFRIAPFAYSEHEGVKRHDGRNKGAKTSWYARIAPRISFDIE